MHLWFTFDLRPTRSDTPDTDEFVPQLTDDDVEFDPLSTIESITAALERLGHRVTRVGDVKVLATRLVIGGDGRPDLVFNIAEGHHGVGREGQVPSLLEAYAIPYVFSDPLTMATSLYKPLAKQLFRDAGLPTPDWVTVDALDDRAAAVDLLARF